MTKKIEEIAKIIEKNGGRLYLVGGAIRDKLMGIEPQDKDYCITGFNQEKFKNIFPEAKIQGKDFPVFILEGQEFALARKERKSGIGHKEFEFLANPDITIEQDLARRDVTINSIAEDILTKELIDPFQGKQDIQKGILRKTTKAFAEDPLRVYRVARFASTLEFKVEKNTLMAMESLKDELITLSKERIFTEFQKALASKKPSIFFQVLKEAKLLQVHFPEIAQLIGKTQPENYHPEGDSYKHTMIVVDNSAKLTNLLPVRFSCLVHDLGKGTTPQNILPHHYGHEERGIEQVRKLGKRIGIPVTWEKCGKVACKWHMKAGIFEQMSPSKKVTLVEQVEKTMLGLEGLKIVVACDKSRQGEDLEIQLEKISFEQIGKRCIGEINGNFIQKKYPQIEGKSFSNYLHQERVNWMKFLDKK